MKIYSQAYSDTLLTAAVLEEATLALVNLNGPALNNVIDREAAKFAARGMNRLRGALGLKATTPVAIRALSDLYQAAHPSVSGRRALGHDVRNPWQAARLFAQERTMEPVPGDSRSPDSSRRGSQISLKSLRFSAVSEEIPAAPWRLSEKKRAQLVSTRALSTDDRDHVVAQAKQRHDAKLAAAGEVKGYHKLKFVI